MIAFVKQALPASPTNRVGRVQVPRLHPSDPLILLLQVLFGVPTVGSFVFGRLNVRVIRGTAPDPAPLESFVLPQPEVNQEQCHAVGVVTVSGVHVDLTVDSDVTMTARLCHVEVTDCSVAGTKYPVVCRTGKLQGELSSGWVVGGVVGGMVGGAVGGPA